MLKANFIKIYNCNIVGIPNCELSMNYKYVKFIIICQTLLNKSQHRVYNHPRFLKIVVLIFVSFHYSIFQSC